MDLRTGSPFWAVRNGLLGVYPALAQDEAADVVVIGAGVTGALVAYELTSAGLDVIVVDKRDVVSGSSAVTTGLLQYETDSSLEELCARVGEEAGVRAYQLGLDAIDHIESLCARLGDACGFARRPSLYLASASRDVEALTREYALRRRHGFDVTLLDRAALQAGSSLSAPAAIRSQGDAEIDCHRFSHALLAAAHAGGARIYDRTRVVRTDARADGVALHMDGGLTVRASQIVCATGYETARELSRRTGHLASTWAFVSEPVDEFPGWPDRCLIGETARPYLYARTTDDHRVLVGGLDEPFSTRHQDERLLRRKVRRLREQLRGWFPDLALDIAYAWAGVFASTDDGLPFIGQVPEHPRTWFALGYGGNGITFSAIAAQILRDALTDRPNADAAIFGFDRPTSTFRQRVWPFSA